MKPIRILLADDHAIVRTGLAFLLGTKKDFEIVGEARDGMEAVALAEKLKPDVVVMDLMMPVLDGAAATERILKANTGTKVLILTSFGSESGVSAALKSGASGALSKSSANTELVDAIRTVVGGGKALSHDIELMLQERNSTPELSVRQRQMLESITRGLTNEEIARQYGLSVPSVKTHIVKLFAKIGAANRTEAASIAFRKMLLKS